MTPLLFTGIVLGLLLVFAWLQDNLLAILSSTIGILIIILVSTGVVTA